MGGQGHDDDLDAEIARKFRRGYPQTNIIFEDSATAVLIQHGQEVTRCPIDDVGRLEHLLDLFFGYQRPEIADFRKAIEQFKLDLPAVLKALRGRIDDAYADNRGFAAAARAFLAQARETINPAVEDTDIREMLIQHILTEDIFVRVFGESDFHRENNVAKALYALEQLFFRGDVKQRTLHALEPYYAAIRSTAALIQSHSEKQGFLKAIYENFYKVYNPKAADRLGVVYTPNEIVRFMVESADWLCEKHFGRNLIDRDVEILDPATGTGTFIVELLEHFRGRPEALKYKYLNELHANEMAILPYYVANLNIEATYAALMREHAEFPNLCFVDTLDNTEALRAGEGQHYRDLLGAISTENVDRIKRQNDRTISVIIGNPPYNANQRNENENNRNREYPEIDGRIRSTYIAESTAQKTKLYDMYVRFFRWASDRIAADGIVAFVTNRSFLDKRNFDGFRKLVAREFSDIYVVDLGGDVRENPRLSGTAHNVFGIQTGVAIGFFVKRRTASGNRLRYGRRPEFETREEKLVFLHNASLDSAAPELIRPDAKCNWLNLISNDFESLLPLASKDTKATRVTGQERAIFKLYSLGVSTNRDEWLYDRDRKALEKKVRYLIAAYNAIPADAQAHPDTIKWSRNLKRRLASGQRERFSPERMVRAGYRPFNRRWLYQSKLFTDELGLADELFPPNAPNRAISFSAPGSRTNFCVLAVDGLADLHFGAAVDGYQQVARYRFVDGERVDNITDWALARFTGHYGRKGGVTKDGIFAYVYAVLHDPIYRESYRCNVQREFPRIPFYPGFARWREWGESLLDSHINHASAAAYPLDRVDAPGHPGGTAGQPRAILKADRQNGIIVLDEDTQLTGVPTAAWGYTLGNRCAIDWVLDQHKERAPRDPVVREKFDTYRFADHKEEVIDLLRRVVTVSVKTVEVVDAMRTAAR